MARTAAVSLLRGGATLQALHARFRYHTRARGNQFGTWGTVRTRSSPWLACMNGVRFRRLSSSSAYESTSCTTAPPPRLLLRQPDDPVVAIGGRAIPGKDPDSTPALESYVSLLSSRIRASVAVGAALAVLIGCTADQERTVAAPSVPTTTAGPAAASSGAAPPSVASPHPVASTLSPPDAGPVEASFGRIPGVVRQVQPSVVTIFTRGGLGSGVVYRADGLIVTNEHVVRGQRAVEVAFADGTRHRGLVRGADPITDLAVVAVERQGLPAAEFQTALPAVGELAVAIGSPLGLVNSVTAGVISGLQREIPGAGVQNQALVDLIQTDAPISPGNSGGALVNAAGEVVGINDAYIPPQAGAVSLGFAIPTATVQDVVEQLLEDGTVEHAFLGVQPGPITPQIATALGLDRREGAIVLAVTPNSPAARAQLRPGDVLTAFAGAPVRTVEDFLAELRGQDPGSRVELQILRDGQPQTLIATLSERP